MKKIILTLFFIISVFSFGAKYKMIMSDNASGKLDINKATREEMLRSGVAESYVSKIISFRDIKGGIKNKVNIIFFIKPPIKLIIVQRKQTVLGIKQEW